MLLKPMKRICPSLSLVARSKTPRHLGGLMKGKKPSTTSISANAPRSKSQGSTCGPKFYFFAGADFTAGAAAAAGAETEPRIAWKKSLFGSTTITSDFDRKLVR
jgi:hypothetical protein